MKKTTFVFAMLLMSVSAVAQTFVSTVPGKRNVLIEEYTGVNCQYCPLGHKATDQTLAAFPGRAFAINIHQGTFASRFTTQWGNALAGQASIDGYPSSSMNRHAFDGGSIHIDPGQAYSCAMQVMEMDAPVNVAATVDIDPVSRLMVVKVEVFYTGNAANSTNMLNVALIQSNVLGPQQGGSAWYPENMVNGQYRHNHILRDLLTGQWGEVLEQTTAGSFYSKEYAYVVPQRIGDLDVANLDDLSVLVFVCEDHKEILNACEAIRVGDKAYIAYGNAGGEECSLAWNPYVAVVNSTDRAISDLKFNVDGVQVVSNKTIAPFCTDTVRVVNYGIEGMPVSHQVYSQTTNVLFDSYSSNGSTVTAGGAAVSISYGNVELFTVEGPLTLSIRYDSYPTEVMFSLAGLADCRYYYQSTGTSADANKTKEYILSPATAGVYRLKVFDTGGDGLSGTVSVKDAQDNTLFSRNGSNLMVWDDIYFNITNPGSDGPQGPVVGIDELEMECGEWKVWPNPMRDVLHIEGEVQKAQIMDMSGRLVVSTEGNAVNVASLPAGVYFLRIVSAEGIGMKKIVKQ